MNSLLLSLMLLMACPAYAAVPGSAVGAAELATLRLRGGTGQVPLPSHRPPKCRAGACHGSGPGLKARLPQPASAGAVERATPRAPAAQLTGCRQTYTPAATSGGAQGLPVFTLNGWMRIRVLAGRTVARIPIQGEQLQVEACFDDVCQGRELFLPSSLLRRADASRIPCTKGGHRRNASLALSLLLGVHHTLNAR